MEVIITAIIVLFILSAIAPPPYQQSWRSQVHKRPDPDRDPPKER